MTKKDTKDEIISETKDGNIVFNKDALVALISDMMSEQIKPINNRLDALPNIDRIEKKLENAVGQETINDVLAHAIETQNIANSAMNKVNAMDEFVASVTESQKNVMETVNNLSKQVESIGPVQQIDPRILADTEKLFVIMRELGIDLNDINADQIKEIAKKFAPMMQMGMMMGGGMPGMPHPTQAIADDPKPAPEPAPKNQKIYAGKQCQTCGNPFNRAEWEAYKPIYAGKDGAGRATCPNCNSENYIYHHRNCSDPEGLFLTHLGPKKILGSKCPICGGKLGK